MEIKKMIYDELKLIGKNEWKLFVGTTDLGYKIFMMIDTTQEVPFFSWNKISGIRMDKGDYLLHCAGEYNLKSEDIEDLTDFLNNKNKYNITNFEYMLIVWNYFNKHKVKENLQVPNYKTLPKYEPTYKFRGVIIQKNRALWRR